MEAGINPGRVPWPSLVTRTLANNVVKATGLALDQGFSFCGCELDSSVMSRLHFLVLFMVQLTAPQLGLDPEVEIGPFIRKGVSGETRRVRAAALQDA